MGLAHKEMGARSAPCLGRFGGDSWDRTSDLSDMSRVLYQLSYITIAGPFVARTIAPGTDRWWERYGSRTVDFGLVAGEGFEPPTSGL